MAKKRDAFEEARNQSFGDGERFSMPEYKATATPSKPVKEEHKETISKSTQAAAPEAPKSPLESAPLPKVERSELPPMKRTEQKRNFDKAPPKPTPKPVQAKVKLGRPQFVQTDGSFVSSAKPQRNPVSKAIGDATDFAVENLLPFAVGPARGAAGAAAKAIGNAGTKALPSPQRSLPAPKPKRLQDSSSGPTINMGGPPKPKKPRSEPLNAGVKRTVNRGKKKK